MPTIASFYGIIIMMFLRNKEHEPPHIHAYYGEYGAAFDIATGKILYDGDFPRSGKRMVKEFILKNKDELLEMWNTGNYHSLPQLNKEICKMYNKLISIRLEENLIVISEFLNGVITKFDLKIMLTKYPIFNQLLENNDLYKIGHIDQGGFGIIWNDEIDFSADSLYYDGTIIERKSVDINVSIAIMVTEARIKKGLGQKDLAKITGIHQAEISKIERGIGNPSVKTLDRIAKGLGLNLKLFLE